MVTVSNARNVNRRSGAMISMYTPESGAAIAIGRQTASRQVSGAKRSIQPPQPDHTRTGANKLSKNGYIGLPKCFHRSEPQ